MTVDNDHNDNNVPNVFSVDWFRTSLRLCVCVFIIIIGYLGIWIFVTLNLVSFLYHIDGPSTVDDGGLFLIYIRNDSSLSIALTTYVLRFAIMF